MTHSPPCRSWPVWIRGFRSSSSITALRQKRTQDDHCMLHTVHGAQSLESRTTKYRVSKKVHEEYGYVYGAWNIILLTFFVHWHSTYSDHHAYSFCQNMSYRSSSCGHSCETIPIRKHHVHTALTAGWNKTTCLCGTWEGFFCHCGRAFPQSNYLSSFCRSLE